MSDPQETPQVAGGPHRDTSLTLLQRLRGNEADAWPRMIQLYTPLIYRWCARSGLQGADVEDVLQEVLLAAATHLEGFRRDRPGDSFRGWLRVITRNMVLLHFRKSGRQPQAGGGTDALSLLQEVADPYAGREDDADAEAEADVLLRRALELIRGDFEERTWRMFWQTVIDGRPPVDVAADLGVTPAAVRKAKSRVMHRVKSEFADLI